MHIWHGRRCNVWDGAENSSDPNCTTVLTSAWASGIYQYIVFLQKTLAPKGSLASNQVRWSFYELLSWTLAPDFYPRSILSIYASVLVLL